MKIIYTAICLLLLQYSSYGQFFPVTHTSGTSTIAGNNVTVTPIGGGSIVTGTNCGISPYWFGISNASLGKVAYLYEFSNKAQQVRVRVTGMNNREVISFYINGSKYSITSTNVAAYPGTCSGSTPVAAASGGDLIMPTGVGNGEVVINPGLPIDSFRIFHIGQYQGGGVLYSMEFVNDSSIYIKQPFTDTVFCAGDSFNLKYFTTRTFNAGNTFTAQLSNATGSFATPVNIGSVNSLGTNNDSIRCGIPAGTIAGTGYRLRIVSSNPSLTSNTNGVNIRIKELPNVTATSNTPICAGDTLKLFGSSTTTGVTYSWAGPLAFSSALQNPVQPNASSARQGDYILTASLLGCNAKDTATVVIKALPSVPVAGSNTPVCPGDTIFLTASSATSGVTYAWSGPSSFSSAIQNPSITGASTVNAGTYSVTATLNGCTSAAGNTTLQVYITTPTPVASANNPVCVGTPINLSVNNISGATYQWNGPASFSSILQNPVISNATTAMAGTYSVTATVNGCTSVAGTVNVNVIPAPYVNIFPSPKDSICVGSTIRLNAVPNNAGTSPQYQWYKNHSIITGATAVTYSTSIVADYDLFYCIMTSPNICSTPYTDTSTSISIRVLPYLTPSVSITANPTGTVPSGTVINFTATPVNAGPSPTYQWKRNNANVLGATSNVWGAATLSNNDSVHVEMTSNYLCPSPKTAKSSAIKVSIETTGISNHSNTELPKIYPNPFKNELIVEGVEIGTSIYLYDVLGRLLVSKQSTSMREIVTVDGLPAGKYFMKLVHNNYQLSIKLDKE